MTSLMILLTINRYLDSNRIVELPESLFSNMTELIWLRLDNNTLKDFDLDILSPLKKLRYLNLANNSLTFDGMIFPIFEDLNEL
jgi:Leucine-rich repeat (LRR) protein